MLLLHYDLKRSNFTDKYSSRESFPAWSTGCEIIMNKNRMETFSNGVLAIIVAILVLDMKVPHGVDTEAP